MFSWSEFYANQTILCSINKSLYIINFSFLSKDVELQTDLVPNAIPSKPEVDTVDRASLTDSASRQTFESACNTDKTGHSEDAADTKRRLQAEKLRLNIRNAFKAADLATLESLLLTSDKILSSDEDTGENYDAVGELKPTG